MPGWWVDASAVGTLAEPFAAAERPNDVWSIDFKGWFRTEDGVRIDPLTIQDGFSRCLLVCQGLKRPRALRCVQCVSRERTAQGDGYAL